MAVNGLMAKGRTPHARNFDASFNDPQSPWPLACASRPNRQNGNGGGFCHGTQLLALLGGARQLHGSHAPSAPRSGETHLVLAVAATPSGHVDCAEGAQVDTFPCRLDIRGANPAP